MGKPEYGIIPVVTPCPCALGAWSNMQVGKQSKEPKHYTADEFGTHWDIHVPHWQKIRSRMLAEGPSGPEGSVAKAFFLVVAQPLTAARKERTAMDRSKLHGRSRLYSESFASVDFL